MVIKTAELEGGSLVLLPECGLGFCWGEREATWSLPLRRMPYQRKKEERGPLEIYARPL